MAEKHTQCDPSRKEKLEQELKKLVRRPEVVERIKIALVHMVTLENSEYEVAKDEQAFCGRSNSA